MKEYGSDFHYINPSPPEGKTIYDLFPSANYYADGRQALIHLYNTQNWERLWLPEYYCYEVVNSLKRAGLELCFYKDYPGNNDDSLALTSLQDQGALKPKDAILRVNFFGLRSYRSPKPFSVAVIEDHTHDIIGGWSIGSQADWCIASLRKSLPIPEGGILWSPTGLELPTPPERSAKNEQIGKIRWEAMILKSKYLANYKVTKSSFRERFITTEEFFDTSPVCSLDETSRYFLQSFSIHDWYNKKRMNWDHLRDIERNGVHVFGIEDNGCYPFSLVLLFDAPKERDRVRIALIEKNVYPAVLWTIPRISDNRLYQLSRRILSIHCDARYSQEDILVLRSIIESTITLHD